MTKWDFFITLLKISKSLKSHQLFTYKCFHFPFSNCCQWCVHRNQGQQLHRYERTCCFQAKEWAESGKYTCPLEVGLSLSRVSLSLLNSGRDAQLEPERKTKKKKRERSKPVERIVKLPLWFTMTQQQAQALSHQAEAGRWGQKREQNSYPVCLVLDRC